MRVFSLAALFVATGLFAASLPFAAPVPIRSSLTKDQSPSLLAAADFSGDQKADVLIGITAKLIVVTGRGDGTFSGTVATSLDNYTVSATDDSSSSAASP